MKECLQLNLADQVGSNTAAHIAGPILSDLKDSVIKYTADKKSTNILVR